MTKYLVLDTETLDTKPTGCITALSVIVFDPAVIEPFEDLVKRALTIKFDWQEQIKLGRTTSESTLDFWRKPENREAFNACVKPNENDVSILNLNDILKEYLTEHGYIDTINDRNKNNLAYSRGNAFDFSLLENIYEQIGEPMLLPFWSYRDVRTEIDAVYSHVDENHRCDGYIDGFNIEGMIKHNSAHDCARDILMIQYAHYKLGNKE